jgi:ATP-dependent Lon protease
MAKCVPLDGTHLGCNVDHRWGLLHDLDSDSCGHESAKMFDKIIGYDGIKRTFARSLDSKEPIHILLVGPPGQAKTLFLKCILDTFGGRHLN